MNVLVSSLCTVLVLSLCSTVFGGSAKGKVLVIGATGGTVWGKRL